MSNYTEFSLWVDVVFGDTGSALAFELELATSDLTFGLLFTDFQHTTGMAGMVNTVLMMVSEDYGCTTIKNKLTGTKVCSDFEFFH